TGTGWGFKQTYFDDAAVPVRSPTWEFDGVKVDAPTLEYAHRLSDLLNACVRAKLVVDGLWEWSPGDAGGASGSDDELEGYLPAYIAIRSRRLADGGVARSSREVARSPRRTQTRAR